MVRRHVRSCLAAGGYALVGAHDAMACSSCHGPSPGFEPLFNPADQNDCITCHQAKYNEEHSGTGFPTTCLDCHGTDSWSGATFDHASFADGYQLVGAHETIACSSCHGPSPGFEPLFSPADQNDCITCHQAKYNEEHQGTGFPTTCLDCHGTDSWSGATFDHASAASGYALVGAHDALACSSCHGPSPGFEPLFNPVDQNDCVTCHLSDYNQEHSGTGFPTTCIDCHGTDTWEGATFDHASFADGYQLVGAHEALTCSSCHGPSPGFEPLFNPVDENDCITCHQTKYNEAHLGTGYPTTCIDCHGTDSWSGATFDHASAASGYALVGAHETLPCSSCHGPSPGFEPLFNPADQNDCITCHQAKYNEEHSGTGFPTTCIDCHGTDTWEGATFDHASFADGYQLVGAHEALACSSCHGPSPGFEPLFNPVDENDCITCHQTKYNEAHLGTGYPTTCIDCHGTDSWSGATFDHASAASGYVLVGAHETLPCSSCHGPSPGFEPLFNPADQNDCITCHQAKYNEEHSGTGFPTTCIDCHGTDTWEGATFDHASFADGYQLVGAHDALACSSCHGPSPGFEPLFNPSDQNDCITCHQTDYQTEHGAEAYPTTCISCHNATDWQQTNYNHDADYFPIYSGNHSTVWPTCQTCHLQLDDPTIFTCIDCHDHAKSQTDQDHSQVNGYVYASSACYDCHTNGGGGD